jgi:predicted acetyltransferase
MPELLDPTSRVQASFLAAMDEFQAEGRGAEDDVSMVGTEIRHNRETWHDPAAFEAYVSALCADALPETPRAADWVPCTSLWWIEGDDYLGRLAIRHTLTPGLLEIGGHIGYDVRPSARRQGHATAMLRTALPIARKLGIDSVLVACDTTNVASRRTIETNGGVFEDERQGKLRYWIDTDR